jgi:ubiquinone/menaquinone biosynthesis C-methylase UbiE
MPRDHHDHHHHHHDSPHRPGNPTDYLEWRRDHRDPAVASVYDECSLWASRFGSFLLEHVPLARGMRVLDLGCGNGFPLYEMAHVLGPSSRLWGADVWRAGVARARSKQEVYELPNVAVAAADGARLPFAPASFDLIVSNLGVNNFDDAPTVFEECARVTKRGGVLAIATNLEGHMAELYAVFRHVLEEVGKPAYLERLEANRKHRGTREELVATIQRAGFTPSRAIGTSFTLRYLDGSALLRHYLTRVGFLPGWKAVVDDADRRRVFDELEHHLNHHAEHEGELRMTIPALYLEAVRE